MDQNHNKSLIGKALRFLFGSPPYLGIEVKQMTHAESVALEAAKSPKSFAEIKAERARKSDVALEHLRREIHH
jgi:hypothetical protein